MIDLKKIPVRKIFKELEITVADLIFEGTYECGFYDQIDCGRFILGFGKKTKGKLVYFIESDQEQCDINKDNYNMGKLLGLPFCVGDTWKSEFLDIFPKSVEEKNRIDVVDGDIELAIHLKNGRIEWMEVRDLDLIRKNVARSFTKAIEKIESQEEADGAEEIKKILQGYWMLDPALSFLTSTCNYAFIDNTCASTYDSIEKLKISQKFPFKITKVNNYNFTLCCINCWNEYNSLNITYSPDDEQLVISYKGQERKDILRRIDVNGFRYNDNMAANYAEFVVLINRAMELIFGRWQDAKRYLGLKGSINIPEKSEDTYQFLKSYKERYDCDEFRQFLTENRFFNYHQFKELMLELIETYKVDERYSSQKESIIRNLKSDLKFFYNETV